MVTLIVPLAVVGPDVPVMATDCGPPVTVTFKVPLCDVLPVAVPAYVACSVCVPVPAQARLTRPIPLLMITVELCVEVRSASVALPCGAAPEYGVTVIVACVGFLVAGVTASVV